jgi:hypothetical protein
VFDLLDELAPLDTDTVELHHQIAFDFAQHPENGKRATNGDYPLSGIARCAACGGPLVGHRGGSDGRSRRYRYTTATCTERPHIGADGLEQLALDAARKAPHRAMTGDEVFLFSKAIMLASAEVDAWVKEVSVSDTGAVRWKEGLKERETALAARQAEFDAARETRGSIPDLDDPTPEEMRQAFAAVLRSLTVQRGRGPTRPAATRGARTTPPPTGTCCGWPHVAVPSLRAQQRARCLLEPVAVGVAALGTLGVGQLVRSHGAPSLRLSGPAQCGSDPCPQRMPTGVPRSGRVGPAQRHSVAPHHSTSRGLMPRPSRAISASTSL